MESNVIADRLEIRDAEGRVTRVDLTGERVVIGRAEDAGVRLDHAAVSRHHAELFRDPFGRWWVRDLKSHNGTKVNGVRVEERVVAYDDVIEVGPFVLRVRPAGCLTMTTCTTSTSTASVGDAPYERITSLDDVSVPRVGAAHLDVLGAFARRLHETADPLARLRALCEIAVSGEFRGRMAVVVRVEKARPGEAAILCGPVCPPGVECRMPYVSRSLVRALIERNQPVMGSNAARGGSNFELTSTSDVMACAALACPLCSEAGAVEFLYVLLPPEFGSAEWLSLVALAAGEFQRSSLSWLSRLQSEDHARIEKELERARVMQRRLIPVMPNIPGLDLAIGFEPCRWVGGDYVDVAALRDGRAFLTIADVCGKGPQAALVAAGVHSRVHAGLDAGADLAAVMGGVNRYLHGFLPPDSFVTMVAAALDPATGDMQIVNAGHPAPVILDASGAARELAAGLNPPLRVAESLDLGHERLAPGEMLAMFTDGLVEFGQDRSLDAGVGRLVDALRSSRSEPSAAAVALRLRELLRPGEPDALASDDRTFLLARRC